MVYTPVNAIYKPVDRQAESVETRLGIRRHEDDSQHRKNQKHSQQDEGMFGSDSTIVSIESLKKFLEDLINEHTSLDDPGASSMPREAVQKSFEFYKPLPLQSSAASKAARTYQKMYQVTHMDEEEQTMSHPPSMNAASLSGEDVRTIFTLIKDLDKIRAHNIENLTIRLDGTFLGSLENTVKALKATLRI